MRNAIYTGDNLFVLTGMNSKSVDLIYLDPPFNSKRMYSAPVGSKAAGASFKDLWSWEDVDEERLDNMVSNYPSLVLYIKSISEAHDNGMMAYITYMSQRIIELHRILKDTGSFYIHIDPTTSHYLKIVLDAVFGKNNFRNEVIWCYKENETATRYYPKKHDIILFYTKNNNYTFNIQRGETTESQEKRYNHIIDGKRFANMKGKMRELKGGAKIKDWWEIPITQSPERTGYPTQKPLALLHRIIKASSNEDDLVLDPFCGCATTCVAAQQLNRKWIGIDISPKAGELVAERLKTDSGLFTDFISLDKPPVRTDIVTTERNLDTKKLLFKDQNKKCNGCATEMEIRHFEIDHIIPRAKGGGDYYENYQLLCGHCNRTKGTRPMEYLRAKIKKVKKLIKNEIGF